MKICVCKEPQFAKLLPIAITPEGAARLEHNRDLLGKFFCYDCGGQPAQDPPVYDHILGETVIDRLIELGVAS